MTSIRMGVFVAACLVWLPLATAQEAPPAPIEATMTMSTATKGSQLHTTQLFPVDAAGKLIGEGDVNAQARAVVANLSNVCSVAKVRLGDIVKVNAFVTNPEIVPAVRKELGTINAAYCVVLQKELPLPGAMVALDAVATIEAPDAAAVSHIKASAIHGMPGRAHAAVLPAGRTVYISGQAEDDPVLGVATAKTLDSLLKTLAWLGLDKSHVVNVKTFTKPMAAIGDVNAAIDIFFEGKTPAVIHTEWMNTSPAIEIEMVAFAPPGTATQATGPIAYLTPPGMTESPVYSKVTVIENAGTTYLSGLVGPPDVTAEEQIHHIFRAMSTGLATVNASMTDLVKATYYCVTEESSTKLGEIRPQYYDPKRPPAASRSLVAGSGIGAESIVVDMIVLKK